MLCAIESALLSAYSQITVAGLVVQLVSVFLMWTTIRVTDSEVAELAVGGFWEADYRVFGVRRATARASIYKQYVAFSGLTMLLLGVTIQLVGVALARVPARGLHLWAFLAGLALMALVVYLAARRLADSQYRARIEGAVRSAFDRWQEEGAEFNPVQVADLSAEIRALLNDVRCEEQIETFLRAQFSRVKTTDEPA